MLDPSSSSRPGEHLVAGAGLNTYRFSLEWSRIEPEEGEYSRAALDHSAGSSTAAASGGCTRS
jgi:beta-galactosidase GanA